MVLRPAVSTEPDCEGGHMYDDERVGLQDCAKCGAPLIHRIVLAKPADDGDGGEG